MQCQKLKTYMETGRVVFLPVRAIRPNPSQPRKVFQPEPLQELADSIARHGILQPLSVRRIPGGYELIAGERRLRAAQIAGLSEVPCIVMQMDARESGMAAMVENLQRQDLDFIEEALGIRHLLEEYQMSQEQAARLLGKSQSAVANKLRLLRHSDAVLAALRIIIFLVGRYGWKLGGFNACQGAWLETVEVGQGTVHIRGGYPGSFPSGFCGYYAAACGGRLCVGER